MGMTSGELFELLGKHDRFSLMDLQRLREGLLSASASFHHKANEVWLSGRLSVETIGSLVELNESIRKLDESSVKLANTTNKLTTRILWLTVVGVFVGVVQLVMGILWWSH